MNKVLVIGESCTDIFIYGISNRKSPEGNGPVFLPKEEIYTSGMAANTANNLKSMGIEVDIFSDTGDITKIRYVNEQTNELYIRIDENDSVDRINTEELENLIKKYDAVVISDYCKGFLTEEDIEYISTLHELVMLDTKKRLGNWCKNLKFIKINRFEAEHNKNFISQNEWLKDKLIITLDGNGAQYQDTVITTNRIESADVSGAGDTFVAGFITKYLESNNIEESIRWANYCAGEVVKQKGVSVFRQT